VYVDTLKISVIWLILITIELRCLCQPLEPTLASRMAKEVSSLCWSWAATILWPSL